MEIWLVSLQEQMGLCQTDWISWERVVRYTVTTATNGDKKRRKLKMNCAECWGTGLSADAKNKFCIACNGSGEGKPGPDTFNVRADKRPEILAYYKNQEGGLKK